MPHCLCVAVEADTIYFYDDTAWTKYIVYHYSRRHFWCASVNGDEDGNVFPLQWRSKGLFTVKLGPVSVIKSLAIRCSFQLYDTTESSEYYNIITSLRRFTRTLNSLYYFAHSAGWFFHNIICLLGVFVYTLKVSPNSGQDRSSLILLDSINMSLWRFDGSYIKAAISSVLNDRRKYAYKI